MTNVQIPTDQLKVLFCDCCGSDLFVPLMSLREIPMLYSPSGKPERIAIQAGFGCALCGVTFGEGTKKKAVEEGVGEGQPGEEIPAFDHGTHNIGEGGICPPD